MPLPLLSGSTVLLTDENSLPNCSLNHSPITCPLMASASLDLSFGSFTTWKPASSVVNFRNTFPETWEIVRLAYICRLMDGEKKEGNYVCLDAKYLRGKSSGGVLQKGRFVSNRGSWLSVSLLLRSCCICIIIADLPSFFNPPGK